MSITRESEKKGRIFLDRRYIYYTLEGIYHLYMDYYKDTINYYIFKSFEIIIQNFSLRYEYSSLLDRWSSGSQIDEITILT